MKDFKKLQEMDRRARELAGLYAAEKERADSLAEELRAIRNQKLATMYAAEKKRADALEAELRALRESQADKVVVAESETTTATCKESLQAGNAAKCKKLLGEVYDLLDKSKLYINDVESIDRKRELSHYLTRAKNLVDNIISQELSANVSVGNAAKMRDALKYLRDASREFCHLILNSKHNEIYDKYKYKEVSKIRDAIVNANLTLSAPPRNCDLFTNAQDALATIHNDRCYVQNPIDERSLTVNWLFAETKGGVK